MKTELFPLHLLVLLIVILLLFLAVFSVLSSLSSSFLSATDSSCIFQCPLSAVSSSDTDSSSTIQSQPLSTVSESSSLPLTFSVTIESSSSILAFSIPSITSASSIASSGTSLTTSEVASECDISKLLLYNVNVNVHNLSRAEKHSIITTEPNPDASSYPRTCACNGAAFQQFNPVWLKQHHWLHYSCEVNGVFCQACVFCS